MCEEIDNWNKLPDEEKMDLCKEAEILSCPFSWTDEEIKEFVDKKFSMRACNSFEVYECGCGEQHAAFYNPQTGSFESDLE